MRRRTWVEMVVFFAAIPFLAGQDSKGNQAKKPDEDYSQYFQVKAGTEMVFKATGIDEKGKKEVKEGRLVCKGTEQVKGVDCYVLEERDGDYVLWKKYWAVDGEGLKLYRRLEGGFDDTLKTPNIYVKFPPKKGEQWEWQGMLLNIPHKEVHKNEGEETVEIPLGKFNCTKMYEETYVNVNRTWEKTYWGTKWWNKDKGLVKQDFHFVRAEQDKRETLHIIVELKEYKEPKKEQK